MKKKELIETIANEGLPEGIEPETIDLGDTEATIFPSSLTNAVINNAEQMKFVLETALSEIPADAEMQPKDFELVSMALRDFYEETMMSLIIPTLRDAIQMELDARLASLKEIQKNNS